MTLAEHHTQQTWMTNMENAINAFTAATTEEDVRAAYDAMVEWSDAPEGLEADAVDNMLNELGLPSLSQRLIAVAD